MPTIRSSAVTAGCVSVLVACAQPIPKEALQLSPESLQDRQMQTRRFDTADEAMLLSASASLLQDLGFTIDESESDLGVLVASKDRQAIDPGEIMAALFVGAFLGVSIPVDRQQKLRTSIVTRPVGQDKNSLTVRVTFQRIVWNSQGNVSRRERLNKLEQYQEFFEKLSKAVFLEAHEI